MRYLRKPIQLSYGLDKSGKKWFKIIEPNKTTLISPTGKKTVFNREENR